jgi:23S rRNA (pseudouridine1915-N3)-methyltransferase
MKLVILAGGRRHDPLLAGAIEEYSKRLARYVALSWQLLEPARGQTDEAAMRRIETEALLAQLKTDDYVILLDERGESLTSRQLAGLLEKRQQSAGRVVFIIGGAFGVEPALMQRASLAWSLSALTFPHQLVRLILAEQLYRACTIMRGEPYHHE